MKKILILVLLVVFLMAIGGIWFYQNMGPVSNDNAYQNFVIAKGSSASQVAQDLQGAGLIKNALAFKVYVRLTGVAQKIFPGEYQLSPSFSLYKIVNQFLHGPTEIWVTIPEGLRVEEVAQRYAAALGKNTQFVADFVAAGKTDEGYLFPETYLFPKETPADKIVARMRATFDSKVNFTTTRENIILASLVERETKTDQERPVVAGILLNRMRLGMPLQVDASIQYLLGKTDKWWPNVLLGDRQIRSPFNTYLNTGLPPSPICSPSLSSIQAAVNPAPSDYIYYLHDAQGVIHYAQTLEEHNANIAKYIQ